MPKPFPTQPSLEHFRKQAKQLLRDLRSGQTDAAARVARVHPRRLQTGPTRDPSLHDAQVVVAREFGFASWQRLQDAVTRKRGDQTDGLRALITGGAGFIGSHLSETLLAQGHHVIALDDLSCGSQENVDHLLADARFELIVGDICDADLVDRLVGEVDLVFHLAAAIHSDKLPDPLHLWRTNVDGTHIVVEAASRHAVRFLQASSSVVYGKTEGRETLREDADLILGDGSLPGWDYAVSKIANEHLVQAHIEHHGLRATIVRPFNVIGPRSKEAVVPQFLQQASSRSPLTIHGDGSHRRCFTDVRDVSQALARLILCDDACGQIVNIGTRTEHSLTQLSQLVKRATQSDSTVTHIPYDKLPSGGFHQHIPWKTPNLSKARKLIGYTAVHPLEECLQEMVALH